MAELALVRNRVAHHEPVLLRAKHVFAKKTGQPKVGNDLVTSLLSAVEKFERQVTTIIGTARIMAPMASETLDDVAEHVARDVRPLREAFLEAGERLRRERKRRRAERRA